MATTDEGTSPQSTISSNGVVAATDFGANEWLVEDMYERYLADPASVDAAWHDFFADYRPTRPGSPAAAPARADDDEAAGPTATAVTPSAPATPAAVAARQRPRLPRRPRLAAAQAPADRPARAARRQHRPRRRTGRPRRSPTAKRRPCCAARPRRVVANMETSLAVPTATSVRAVPAKLIADNRVVINNHLRRARGGKVSFTHLIGYAVRQGAGATTRR